VVDIRYQAGRFGSGFKPQPKSDAGIRELPLAPEVVAAIGRQLPPGTDLDDLVFTGPGGGVVAPGTRTVLSRHNFRRTYHGAIAKLADPATLLRPTAARVLKTLRTTGPQTADELVAALAQQGRAIRPTTIQTALGELAASGLAAADGRGPTRRWSPLVSPGDPLLDAVDLRGAQHLGSTMGARYRHTTPAEMATRVVAAIQARLVVVVGVAEQVVEAQPTRVPREVVLTTTDRVSANFWQTAVRGPRGEVYFCKSVTTVRGELRRSDAEPVRRGGRFRRPGRGGSSLKCCDAVFDLAANATSSIELRPRAPTRRLEGEAVVQVSGSWMGQHSSTRSSREDAYGQPYDQLWVAVAPRGR
jgi:Penicillinase repressor